MTGMQQTCMQVAAQHRVCCSATCAMQHTHMPIILHTWGPASPAPQPKHTHTTSPNLFCLPSPSPPPGGEVVSEDLGHKLEKTELAQLGSVKKVTVTKDDTIMLHGGGEGGDRKQLGGLEHGGEMDACVFAR